MAIYSGQYNDDVNDILGVRRPRQNLLRFGAEIETGWPTNEARDNYFTALSAAGLEGKVISKFDRSIVSENPSEIVTLPYPLEVITDVVEKIGGVLEPFSSTVSVQNCGVHIHASQGIMSLQDWWKVVSAIMCNENAVTFWNLPTSADAIQKFHAGLEHQHNFWSTLALRRPGEYCSREVYSRPEKLTGPGHHHYAVTMGHGKPTMEFRLFKTARSARVLRSYPEAVAALIAFSLQEKATDAEPPQPRVTLDMVDALVAEILSEEAVLDWIVKKEALRRAVLLPVSPEQAEYWRTEIDSIFNQVQSTLRSCVIIQGQRLDFALQDVELAGLTNVISAKRRIALREMASTYGTSKLAPPWPGGNFPVRKFTHFILDHRATYPALAKRLDLPKFAEFVQAADLFGGTHKPVVPFDEVTPHEEIRVGCLCRYWPAGAPLDLRITKTQVSGEGILVAGDMTYEGKAITVRGNSPATESYSRRYLASGEDIIHLCAGATSLEGHGE